MTRVPRAMLGTAEWYRRPLSALSWKAEGYAFERSGNPAELETLLDRRYFDEALFDAIEARS